MESASKIGLWLNKFRLGLIIYSSKYGFVFPDPNVEIHTV